MKTEVPRAWRAPLLWPDKRPLSVKFLGLGATAQGAQRELSQVLGRTFPLKSVRLSDEEPAHVLQLDQTQGTQVGEAGRGSGRDPLPADRVPLQDSGSQRTGLSWPGSRSRGGWRRGPGPVSSASPRGSLYVCVCLGANPFQRFPRTWSFGNRMEFTAQFLLWFDRVPRGSVREERVGSREV